MELDRLELVRVGPELVRVGLDRVGMLIRSVGEELVRLAVLVKGVMLAWIRSWKSCQAEHLERSRWPGSAALLRTAAPQVQAAKPHGWSSIEVQV